MKPTWFNPKGLASRTGFLASALAAVVLVLMSVGTAAAQEGAIAGSVTAITGEELTGVQVFVPGTSYGTLTDEAGRFRIGGVPAGSYTLRASIIGYQGSEMPVTVTAGETATVDFVLEVSAVALDEVVATITGPTARRELSTDISTIDATTVTENTRTQQITSVLKGQATGVYVRQASGTVGTGADVRIRGTGSISLSTQPLYVIDGAIIDSEANANDAGFAEIGVGGQDYTRLSDLNPDEIESIEVIKGPAASALWGARGTAGVVVITTKQGAAGETRWNARADLGVNEQVNGYVDPSGGASFSPGEFSTTGWNPLSFGFPTDTIYTMNLLEEFSPFSNGFNQNYNGNVAGGAGIWNYFGSVQYGNEQGTLPNNHQEKFNFRANFGVDPSSKVNLSFSNGYTSSQVTLPDNDNNGFGYIGVAMIGYPWNHGINVADPVTGSNVDTCPYEYEYSKLTGIPTQDLGICPRESDGSINAFYAGRTPEDVATIVNEKAIERYTGSGNATWNPITQWTNRFTIGYDMVNDRTANVFPVDPDQPFSTLSLGYIAKPYESSRNLTLQGTSTYDWQISDPLGFEFVGGVQWFRRTIESTLVTGQTFPATGPAVNNSVINTGNDLFIESKSLGFFVQGQFDWQNRLFVNGAVRWDNNSSQGENLGVKAYPKFGASFVALEGEGIFNTLRFRGGWGQSGTLPRTNDPLALVGIQQVAFQGSDQLGITPDQPGNPLLQPETGEEWEAGFDLSMLTDRIGLTFTYYDQKTKNTVVAKDLAPSSGFPEERYVNIGQIDNSGFEVELDALIFDEDNFSWDLRLLSSRNHNNIAQLVDPIIYGLGGSSQRHQEGLPFGSYVQPQVVIGADGEAAVLACDETPGTWGPGDTPGAKEDFCDPIDNARWNGDPTPTWEGSLQTTFQLFKYVQLYFLFDFQAGQQRFNSTGEFMCSFLGGGLNGGVCLEGMTENGVETNGDWTNIVAYAADIGSEYAWIMDADWGKWRTAQIRFDMPSSVTRFLKLSGLQIQLIGENLITWTDYNGWDPEINWAGQSEASVAEFLTLPPNRRFLGTINIFF